MNEQMDLNINNIIIAPQELNKYAPAPNVEEIESYRNDLASTFKWRRSKTVTKNLLRRRKRIHLEERSFLLMQTDFNTAILNIDKREFAKAALALKAFTEMQSDPETRLGDDYYCDSNNYSKPVRVSNQPSWFKSHIYEEENDFDKNNRIMVERLQNRNPNIAANNINNTNYIQTSRNLNYRTNRSPISSKFTNTRDSPRKSNMRNPLGEIPTTRKSSFYPQKNVSFSPLHLNS